LLKKFLKFLKIGLPIGLAIYLFYDTFQDPVTRAELVLSFQNVNYFYILLMLGVVAISHMSRAYRWGFLMEPLGYITKFKNAFYAVMIGYVVNMLIPRGGEISRAVFFSRAEKVPIEKAFGTIAAERVFDLLALAIITTVTFYIERETALKYAMELYEKNKGSGEESFIHKPIVWIGILSIIVLAVLFFRNPKVKNKIENLSKGLWEGAMSIVKTKKKWAFLLHTLIIWFCYLLMFYIPFLSLDSTKDIGLNAIFVAFIFSAFSIVLTPGGTGAYHKAVGLAIGLFGYSAATGEALGLIIWCAQAVFNIVVGLLSLYLINKQNENYLGNTTADIG
jgi:uncharacterized protein (TIRG00374 family)